MNTEQNSSAKRDPKWVMGIGLFGLFTMIILLALSVSFIGEHEVGVEIRKGEVIGTRTTGINWTLPLNHSIEKIPTTVQSHEVTGVSAATQDNYDMANSTIEFRFRIPDEDAKFVYRNFPDYPDLIGDEVKEATKNVIGGYRIQDVPPNRQAIGNEIAEQVRESLTAEMNVNLQGAALAYYEWDSRAESMITSLQNKENEIDQAEMALQQDRLENKRKEENAESKAERDRIEAEGKAEATNIASKAEAESLERIATVLKNNPQLLTRQRIEAWDGAMPMVSSGESSVRLDLAPEQLQND